MVRELADFRIPPGKQAEFESAIVKGVTSVIANAHGFIGYSIHRCIETPERYVLQIEWANLEDHTVGFRQSPAFSDWRALVGPFFAAPPVVEHFHLIAEA